MALAPGSRVTGEQMTGTTDEQLAKLVALAAGGTPPDLALHLDHGQTVRLAVSGGVLEPLDAYIARDRQLNVADIHPEVQAQYRFQRKVYGVAHGISLTSLFVNPDLFNAAGVPAPAHGLEGRPLDAPRSGRRGQQDDPPRTVGGLRPGGAGGGADDLEPQHRELDPGQRRRLPGRSGGAPALRPGHPPDAGGAGAPGRPAPEAPGVGGRGGPGGPAAPAVVRHRSRRDVLRGLVQDQRPARATQSNASWDLATLPRTRQPVVGLGGSGVSLLAGSKQKDASWELLRFMVDVDYNRLQAKAGLDTPARTSVLTGAEYLGEAPRRAAGA